MITRVSENARFNMVTNGIATVQNAYNMIMEKMASQKRINKPSDDPIGTSNVLNYRSAKAAIGQYQKNINDSNGWLSLTETKLSSISDIITQASEIAVSQGSSTASAETRRTSAESISSIIDEALSLANAKYGDNYLFGGSKTDTQPFSAIYAPASIGNAIDASANTFNGTVVAGGSLSTLTPPAANTTYVAKIVTGGALGAATCKISSDGGKTWSATPVTVPVTGIIPVLNSGGNVVTMTIVGGSTQLTADDIFQVPVYAQGYYRGSNDSMNVEIGKGNSFSYNVNGGDAFTTQGGGNADLFGHLSALKTALEDNDAEAIRAQIDNLKNAQTQVTQYQSGCGTKITALDTAKSNHDSLDLQLTGLMSNTEDADITQLAIDYQMKQIALQASYNMAAQISKNTILDFIR